MPAACEDQLVPTAVDVRQIIDGSNNFKDAITESAALSWDNIRVLYHPKKRLPFTKSDRQPLEILKGVSGIVPAGTLLAIMGASGCGKTTLLNVLTNRNLTDNLQISGRVLVNGVTVGQGLSSISAYVQQDDLFVGIMTVRQHLWFQAMLRMDQHTTQQQREQRINAVIRDLGLIQCQHSPIGEPGKVKSISGGERKRLAFASEVLMNPSILFCDEPTTGLDSFTAENVVTTLKSLALRGKTIICTIHQPSSEIFAFFDNILLLAEGRVMFMGSTARAKSFFSSQGFICPPHFNPADFYIRTLAVAPGKELESRQRIQAIGDAYETQIQNSGLCKRSEMEGVCPRKNSNRIPSAATKPRVKASYWMQLCLVGWRSFLTANKNATVIRIRLLQNITIALVMGLVYLNQKNDQKGVQNINGALNFLSVNLSFGTAPGVIRTFTSELLLFKRDHENGTYRTSVYYICKSLADLPIFLINPILFTAIAYWMVGMRPDFVAFLNCCLCSVLLMNVVVAFGCMISCLAGETKLALALSGPLLVPLSLFGGFLLNDQSIPVYLAWLRYLSWFSYANEIYFVNQWHGFGDIPCDTPNSPCFANGEAVLESFSYRAENLSVDFLALFALWVLFRVIGYFALFLRAQTVWKTQKTKDELDEANKNKSPSHLRQSEDVMAQLRAAGCPVMKMM